MNLVFEDVKKQLNLFRESDVKIHGSERVCVSPYANRLNVLLNEQNRIHQKNTHDFLTFDNQAFSLNIYSADNIPEGIKYIIPVGLHESPDTWAGYRQTNRYDSGFTSLFTLISDLYLKHLREGRAYLLLDNSLEGYECPELYDFLFDEAQKYKIPIQNIIFISGNSQLEDRVNEWSIKTGKTGPRAFGYTHFEFDMHMNAVNFDKSGQVIPTFKDHYVYKKNNLPIIKTYNCLNRKPRNHRIMFYNMLFHGGLLNEGLVSMNDWREDCQHSGVQIDGVYADIDELEHSVQFTPMRWDGTDNLANAGDKINRLNEKSMLGSWLTIVSEAQYNDSQQSVFLSEKTFKPIACCHPFVILGAKGSLKELKKMGYYTFDNLLDESYDELDNIERMEAISMIIRNLSDNPDPIQWLNWLEDRLIYNREVLKFNSLFKPPRNFHQLSRLCSST